LAIKEELTRLKRKLRRLPETTKEDTEEKEEANELIEAMLLAIRELEGNVEETKTEVLVDGMKNLRSVFPELSGSLPIERMMFIMDFSAVPKDIRDEIKCDFDDIQKCYYAGAFRPAIGVCGRILETILARKYFEEKGIDPLEQNWLIGHLIRKCFEDKVIIEPALGDVCNVINKSRINSVHKKRRLFIPEETMTRSIIEFTISLIKKLF